MRSVKAHLTLRVQCFARNLSCFCLGRGAASCGANPSFFEPFRSALLSLQTLTLGVLQNCDLSACMGRAGMSASAVSAASMCGRVLGLWPCSTHSEGVRGARPAAALQLMSGFQAEAWVQCSQRMLQQEV